MCSICAYCALLLSIDLPVATIHKNASASLPVPNSGTFLLFIYSGIYRLTFQWFFFCWLAHYGGFWNPCSSMFKKPAKETLAGLGDSSDPGGSIILMYFAFVDGGGGYQRCWSRGGICCCSLLPSKVWWYGNCSFWGWRNQRFLGKMERPTIKVVQLRLHVGNPHDNGLNPSNDLSFTCGW